MNTQRFKEVVSYLGSKSSRLPVSSKAKLNDPQGSKLGLRTNDLYIRKEIAIGGKISLINANTEQLAGISSFDGNKLNDYINHIIDKVKLSYATDAAADKEAELIYSTALPPAIRNAQLNVKQNNNVVFSLPVSTINNKNTGNTIMDDFRVLDNFEMLVSGEQIDLELEFAQGATIAGTDKHYIELILGGFTTFAK